MAKYDDKRTRSDSNTYEARGNQLYENAAAGLNATGNAMQEGFRGAMASDAGMRDAASSSFQNFINTGGFTPNGISAMRSRAISPIRAAYSNANRDIERRLAMGGTSAGHNVLKARMAREQGQAASDATTNTEAALAGMISQNKLAGTQGMAGLYGTAPGQTSLFSRNVMENQGQALQLTGMEYQRMQDLLNTQFGLTRAPGNSDHMLEQAQGWSQVGQRIFKPGVS